MKKRRILSLLLGIVLTVTLAFCFGACGSDSDSDNSKPTEASDTTDSINDGPNQDKSSDDVIAEDQDEIASNIEKKANAVTSQEAKELSSKATNFYGKWKGTSIKAKEMYGNIELTINKDGTFDANITDEVFSGTWVKEDYGIHFDSEFVDGAMYYGNKGNMVFDEDDFTVTLQKVN